MNAERKRINVRRLIVITALCLFLPLFAGVTLDVVYGIAPAATLIAGLLTIPVASIIVSRVALSEFNLVIDQIAPEDELHGELPQGELIVPESVAVAAQMLSPETRSEAGARQGTGHASQ